MSLNSALSIASGGLANINAQFALISQNVANAATPGLRGGGRQSAGCSPPTAFRWAYRRPGDATDRPSSASVRDATECHRQQRPNHPDRPPGIDSVLGTPGSGSDIGSLLGNLQDSFSTLLTDPSNQTEQSAVVSSATTLAQGINNLSSAYSSQRQASQNDLGSAVNTLNATLTTIGQLSNQIVALKSGNQSTAELENQRNTAVQTLSQLLAVKTAEQPDGDLTVFTSSGLVLPTRSTSGPFSMPDASTPPGSYYPGGGIPGITLGGQDVTSQMVGGQIGADITLRDTTLPTDQAELDEFAYGVSSRFAGQGLNLFTDPDRECAVRRRHAGAGGLYRLRRNDPGQPNSHRRSIPGARRHQCHRQQSDRRGRFHAQSAGWSERHATGGAGRLHHAHQQHRQLYIWNPGSGRGHPAVAEHQWLGRLGEPDHPIQCPAARCRTTRRT